MSGGAKNDYWPGFVDALTNVVIAMVFVIVVLAIALSFSAQLLAKRMVAKIVEQQAQLEKARTAASARPAGLVETLPKQGRQPSTPMTIDAQAPVYKRIEVKGNEAQLKPGAATTKLITADRALQLDFPPGALTVDPDATQQFLASLQPLRQQLLAQPGTRMALVATGPDMALSENQRAAFMRVIGVRNLLLEQGIPAGRIATRIDMNLTPALPSVSLRFEEIQ